MAMAEDVDTSVPWTWILLFVVLALGVGAMAVFFVGGQLIAPPA
ncbi:MAG: hypothetical protein ABEJ70_06315 [Halobacteriaceae archaeon]